MIKKICLLTYFNQYESKRYFTLRLSEALERLDIKTLIVDPQEGKISDEMVESMIQFQPDCLFSFNSSLPDKAGKYLWDYLKIPGWIALVDPAFYAIEMTRSPFSRFTTVDREDCEWLKTNGVEQCYFWPHAVDVHPLKSEERIYDVVFLGTCTDFEALRIEWNQTLKPEEIQVLEGAIQRVWTPPGISLIKALALSVADLKVTNVNFKAIFHYLDHYVRGKDRFELIRSIQHAKVHVFGELSWMNPGSSGWKGYIGDLPNVVLHPPVSYADSFSIMQKAKVCLNSTPFFRHGSHERILNALMSGAVPLTTHNGFVEEFFVPGEDLLTYQTGNWVGINEQINTLLKNESKRLEMAHKGREKVLTAHTWDRRAGELVAIL